MPKTAKNLPEVIDQPPPIDNREDLFIRNLYLKPNNQYQAAVDAGYSKNYAKTGIYKKLETDRMRKKILQYALDNCVTQLPKVFYVKGQIIDHLVENPLDEPNHRHTVKDYLTLTGLLNEPVRSQVTVNIAEFKQVQVAVGDMLAKRLQGADTTKDSDG